MEQQQAGNTVQKIEQGRKLHDQSLTYLLALKANPYNKEALLGLTQSMQGIRSVAEDLSFTRAADYAKEVEQLLLVIGSGNISVSQELSAQIHESIIRLGSALNAWN